MCAECEKHKEQDRKVRELINTLTVDLPDHDFEKLKSDIMKEVDVLRYMTN